MATSRLIAIALLLTVHAVRADEFPPPAYQLAAHDTNVPSTVLFAIALQESGARLRGRLLPWPWTLNIAGSPYRFANRQTACHALLQALARYDAKRVDAGLGQINLGYHGQHFSSPCEALEPYRNLAVTAALLQSITPPPVIGCRLLADITARQEERRLRVTAPAFLNNSND